ncbi:MAG: hypothetical protein AB7G75_10865 [Candidatus Binatia bacterium]
MTTLYYAVGGGFGHVTRAQWVLRTLGYDAAGDVTILARATLPEYVRHTINYDVLAVPEALSCDLAAYRFWLQELLATQRVQQLLLDTFPAGIVGEFCDVAWPPNLRVHLVARWLTWEVYRSVASFLPFRFATTSIIEPLSAEYQAVLQTCSDSMTSFPALLVLPSSGAMAAAEARSLCSQLSLPPSFWLIVHSGPADEIVQLVHYTQDLMQEEGKAQPLVLIAPCCPRDVAPSVLWRQFYPASVLFPAADRIITGCGFNLMRETEPYQQKHWFVPFVRRYDDQFARAARRRATNT